LCRRSDVFFMPVSWSLRSSCGLLAGLKHQIASQVLGWLASWSDVALLIFVQLRLGTTFLIGGCVLSPMLEHVGEFRGGGCRGVGRSEFAAHAAMKRPQRAGARAETVGGHAPGATGAIVDPSTARGESLAATDLRIRTASHPGGTMVVCRPCRPLEAHLSEDDMDRWGLSPRHVREGDAGDPGERGPESTGRFVALGAAMRGRRRGSGMVCRSDQGVPGAQDALHVLSAGRDLLLGKVREREGWGEREDMCRPVIPLQRLGHGVLRGCKARVPRRGSGLRIACSRHKSADKAPPRQAGHITADVMQVEMHLVQRLVQVLTMLDRHLEQIVSMAEEPAEPANVLRRAKRRRPYPITMELLPPSPIAASRFGAARDMRDMAGVAQGNRTPAGLEDLQERHPVYACGGHRHRGDTTGRSPIRQPRQVAGNRATFLHRLGIAVGGHTDPMLLGSHLDAGGMRVEHGHVLGRGGVLLVFFGHMFLQAGSAWGEHGKTGILLRKDTIGEGARQGSDPVSS
jgi:hypothetical protein